MFSGIIQQLNQTADSFSIANTLHRQVGEHLLQRLDPIKVNPKNVLDLGCGIGELLPLLKSRFRTAELFAIDIAEQRLQKMSKKNRRLSKIICADALKLPFQNACFDVIVANLMPHWLVDFNAWFTEMHRILCNDGLLIFSYYGPDTLREIGSVKQSFYDMHDVGDNLIRAHFNHPILDIERYNLRYDNYQDAIEDLQANAEIALFDPIKNQPGEFDLVYEVVYAHAWKQDQPMTSKIDQDGMVRISVDQLGRKT